jgi:hypothetical protein
MEWERVKAVLVEADPWLLSLAAIVYPCRLLAISHRWGSLLALYEDAPAFGVRLRATAVGYLANNCLPFRSGEVIRGGIAVRHGASLGATAATLVLEKVLDLWALVTCALVFGSVYLSQATALAAPLRVVSWVAGVSFAVYLAASLACDEARTAGWLARLGPRGAGIAGKLLRVLTGSCRLMRRGRLLAATVLATVVNWGLEAITLLLFAWALGIPLTLGGALFVVAVVGLGLTIPSSPGGIGLSQYLVIVALRAQGVDTNAATALALLGWTVAYLCMNGVGAVFLLVEAAARKHSATHSAQSRAADD